LTVALCSGDL